MPPRLLLQWPLLTRSGHAEILGETMACEEAIRLAVPSHPDPFLQQHRPLHEPLLGPAQPLAPGEHRGPLTLTKGGAGKKRGRCPWEGGGVQEKVLIVSPLIYTDTTLRANQIPWPGDLAKCQD